MTGNGPRDGDSGLGRPVPKPRSIKSDPARQPEPTTSAGDCCGEKELNMPPNPTPTIPQAPDPELSRQPPPENPDTSGISDDDDHSRSVSKPRSTSGEEVRQPEVGIAYHKVDEPEQSGAIPTASQVTTAESRTKLPHASYQEATDTGRRPGDSGLGRPAPKPRTREEQNRLMEKSKHDPSITGVRHEPSALMHDESLRLAGGSLPAVIWLICLAAASIAGLVLLSQFVSLIKSLVATPLPLAIPLGIATSALLVVAVYSGARLLWAYRKLQARPQVSLKQMRKATDKRLTARDWDLAREEVASYLRGFDLDGPEPVMRLQAVGLDEETSAQLARTRKQLLGLDRYTSQVWLERFVKEFQQPLDDAARNCAWQYAKRIGIITAISPNPVLDSIGVLGGCFQLMGDLCVLYNRRFGKIETAMMLGRIIFQTYIAGQAQEMAEGGAEALGDDIGEHLTQLGIASLAGKILLSKTAEGTANAFLVYRLGRRGIRTLQPVRDT